MSAWIARHATGVDTLETNPVLSAVAERPAHFRPDIEGLRAIAVMAVLLFHMQVPGFGGGFIGVDIFNVISGFLITGLLVREMGTTGRIDLPTFYFRRARRLLPASLTVIVVTLIASAFILSPIRFPSVAGDGAASAFYVANYRFALSGTEYLAATTAPSPYQHFWSLGVEEQFYLVWPMLVLVGSRLVGVRRIGWLLGALTVASFVASVQITDVSAPWAFFSLPTRAWQLGAGGLVAIGIGRWVPRPVLPVLGLAGLGLVLASVVLIDETVPYPGTAALIPTLGTMLLIVAASDATGRLARSLGSWLPRSIGGISYSLYLWHWPLIILVPIALSDDSLALRLVLGAVSIGCAIVSTRVIEAPFRFGRIARTPALRGVATGLAASFLVATTALAAGTMAPDPLATGHEPVTADASPRPHPTRRPTTSPIAASIAPTDAPTPEPTGGPTEAPTGPPGTSTQQPTDGPTDAPTPEATPTDIPSGTVEPSPVPTDRRGATPEPTVDATVSPDSTGSTVTAATDQPRRTQRPDRTRKPDRTPHATQQPTPEPTPRLTPAPTPTPTATPLSATSPIPSIPPTPAATFAPLPDPVTAGALPDGLSPRLRDVKDDLPDGYADGCHLGFDEEQSGECVYGPADPVATVVLYGDSHAAQWLPPLQDLADVRGWRLVALTKSACPPVDLPIWNTPKKREYRECDAWRANALARMTAEAPAIVFLAGYRVYDFLDGDTRTAVADDPATWGAALGRTIDAIEGTGAQVVLIADTPHLAVVPDECLASERDAIERCAQTPADVVDPVYAQLEQDVSAATGARLLSFTGLLCPDGTCPLIFGTTPVYRDDQHLTATFARSLTPLIDVWLDQTAP